MMRNIPTAAELELVNATDGFNRQWDKARADAMKGDTAKFDILREQVDSRTYPRREAIPDGPRRVVTLGGPKIPKPKLGFWKRVLRKLRGKQ